MSEPLDSSWRREPLLQLLLRRGRFWRPSTLHSYRTDSVARWSPRAPLRCVNGVRGLPEPPELHQRLGSVSLGRFAARPASHASRSALLPLPLPLHLLLPPPPLRLRPLIAHHRTVRGEGDQARQHTTSQIQNLKPSFLVSVHTHTHTLCT